MIKILDEFNKVIGKKSFNLEKLLNKLDEPFPIIEENPIIYDLTKRKKVLLTEWDEYWRAQDFNPQYIFIDDKLVCLIHEYMLYPLFQTYITKTFLDQLCKELHIKNFEINHQDFTGLKYEDQPLENHRILFESKVWW